MPVDDQSYVLSRMSKSKSAAGPGIYSASSSSARSNRQYKDAARKILAAVYPRALDRGRILHEQVVAPQTGGKNMISFTKDKFMAPLSAHSSVQGLFFCGRDLGTSGLAGEIQGGYVAACAVLGYTKADLLAGRNVAADIQNLVN